jgi:hypothetical protein
MAFNKNLQNYEMVEDRLKRFWAKCPDGRIDTEVINVLMDGAMIMVKASLYAHRDDKHPVATGLAMDWKGKDSGATKTNWMETSETSAIGRSISNSPYQSKKALRPSREEMQVALGRRENQEKNTPTKVVIEETEQEKQQPEVDKFYEGVKEEKLELPPVENTKVSEEDLKEIEDLNKETIDGWLDNVKAEYHKKMIALNPNIDNADPRMHLNKAFIEKETLKKGRKEFQDGVDHWNKMVKTKPYDIEDREKGNINLDHITTAEPNDFGVMEDVGIKGKGMDFSKFPNMIKEENSKIKNTDLAATEKQINLIYKCSNQRNISENELKEWLNFHFGTKNTSNITRLEASWVLDGFFKNR